MGITVPSPVCGAQQFHLAAYLSEMVITYHERVALVETANNGF